jgi:moderate conductance mechanosensitive channel
MFLSPIPATFLLALRWGLFREGRFMGKVLDEWIADSQEFLHTKLPKLIVIAIIAFVFSRLLRLVTSHMTRIAKQSGAGPSRLAEVKTMSGVIRATGVAIIALIAGFMSLDAIGFNLAPLLASAGIAGVAIGLAAQTIVKDMLNGFLILVEGQFTVGDTVRVAGVNGVVETLTLRHTSVRDSDGTLYMIPNSQIATVANLSSG